MKNKKRGPSCFGTVMLFCAIVLILKFAYARMPDKTEYQDPYDAEISLYDVILEELRGYSTEIVFDYDCTAELFETFERVRDENPELFWIKGSGEYEKKTAGEDVSVTFKIDTDLTLIEILRCRSELESAKNDILSGVTEGMTGYEKLKYIHDVLVKNTEYDSLCADSVQNESECSRLWKSSSAYGCLVDNLAICSGYSAAFQLLAGELGFDCMRVSGHERESGIAHEWNCVKLGDKWYYVDVTWDDPVYKSEDSYFTEFITYEYFMITEDMLAVTHTINENEAVPICNDASMNYYRRNGYYLDAYTFEETSAVIMRQMDREIIEILYSSEAYMNEAAAELFDGYRFYDIEGVTSLGGSAVTYSLGKNGLLRIAVID